MSEPSKDTRNLKDYADGWMTERTDSEIPTFLKFATPIISLGAAAYLALQIYGDIHSKDHGNLVREFHRTSQTSPLVNYTVAALVVIYSVIVARFVFSKHKEG